jgi:hypothetical protein
MTGRRRSPASIEFCRCPFVGHSYTGTRRWPQSSRSLSASRQIRATPERDRRGSPPKGGLLKSYDRLTSKVNKCILPKPALSPLRRKARFRPLPTPSVPSGTCSPGEKLRPKRERLKEVGQTPETWLRRCAQGARSGPGPRAGEVGPVPGFRTVSPMIGLWRGTRLPSEPTEVWQGMRSCQEEPSPHPRAPTASRPIPPDSPGSGGRPGGHGRRARP